MFSLNKQTNKQEFLQKTAPPHERTNNHADATHAWGWVSNKDLILGVQ